MGNHLLLETPKRILSHIMRHINVDYATYFNIKRQRNDQPLQGRFKAIHVELDELCKELSRYIHDRKLKKQIKREENEFSLSSVWA